MTTDLTTGVINTTGGKRTLSANLLKTLIAYGFLLPALVGLLVFRIYPILLTYIGSFYNINYRQGGGAVFVGLQNYQETFTDPIFWQSLKITIIFNLLINPIQISLSLLVAMLVHKNTRLNRIFRTAYLLPLGIAIGVSSAMWRILLNPNDGLVNSVLRLFGIGRQPFLTSVDQAFWCIILVASWTGISYWMLLLLAGLQDIPGELYEAAKIDGANAWQVFWRITLPLLKRVLLFVTVADTSANFLLFAPIYILTRGGPQFSTNTLMYETYTSAFIYSDMHRALTLSAILLILLLGFILLEMKMFGRDD